MFITVSADTKNDLSGIGISIILLLKEENRIRLRTSDLYVILIDNNSYISIRRSGESSHNIHLGNHTNYRLHPS